MKLCLEEDILEHIVCLNQEYDSLEDILTGKKVMIVIGSYGKKFPYGQIHVGDMVFLTETNNGGLITARAVICNILCTHKVSTEEAAVILVGNKDKLNLSAQSFQKLIGKKYLVFIEFSNVECIEPVKIYSKGQLASWTVIYT